MTDSTELDELASAYLDDEVSAEERARIEADPDLLDRVGRLRAAAQAIGADVAPLDDTEAAAQRRRALRAGQDRASSGRPTTPVPIRPRPTWLPSPAAAAAVVIVIALVGVLLLVGPGQGDDADSSAGQATSGGSADQPAAEDNESRAEGSPPPGDDAVELGTFETEAELRAALERVAVTSLQGGGLEAPETSSEVGDEAIDRCDRSVEAGQNELGGRLASATARLAGREVLVFSHPVRGGSDAPVTQLTVADAQTCRVLFAVQR